MKNVTVSAGAIKEVLQALIGPGHLIRELQATMGSIVGNDNPITKLIKEYNEAAEVGEEPVETTSAGMTALDFINIIRPEHDRNSCSDDDVCNGFGTRNGDSWHGRCTRCMYLQIIAGHSLPKDMKQDELFG